MLASLGAATLARSFWLGPALCLLTRWSDRFLTVRNARLYKAQTKIAFEGSFEINPHSQADVDALRVMSRRFISMLLLPPACALLVWLIAHHDAAVTGEYLLVLGFFLLTQAAIHVTHLRTWYLFKVLLPCVPARTRTPRAVALRASAFQYAMFGALFASIFAVTSSCFVLGGVMGCATLAGVHYRLARQFPLQPIAA